MPRPSSWTDETIAYLLRLNAAADADPKITLSVMADLLNDVFGTQFSRNAIAGKFNRLTPGVKYARAPRKCGQKPEPERKAFRCARQGLFRSPSATPAIIAPSKPPLPKRPPSTHQCEPVALLDRKPSQCGWPINDGGPFLFCGAAKESDPVYCDFHRAKSALRPWRRAGVAAP